MFRQVAVSMAALAVLSTANGCNRALYHRVRPGENLYRISKAYGVSVERLAEANQLKDPSRIEVGQRLFIPGAKRPVPVDLVTPRTASLRPPQRGELPPVHARFAWPVVGGTVTSSFGQRGRSFHDGIDISAPAGTPVYAAQDGEVVFSDALRGYGNVVILRHTKGFATVYAHNQRNHAEEGRHVRRGDVIGAVGDTGRTSGANLHFEVRYDNIARDPMFFLPPPEQVAAPKPAPAQGG